MLKKFYQELLAKHGANSYQTLSWISPATQNVRFAQLVKLIANKQDKFTLLDVGCGFADLYSYLKENGFHNIDYSGIDLMPDFIAAAKAAQPDIKLTAGDFLMADFAGRYDYIVASGALNVIADPARPPYEFTFQIIDKMFALAGRGIAFNMLWDKRQNDFPADPRYMYFDLEKVKAYCGQKAASSQILTDYLPHDFTILLTKTTR